MLEELNYPGVSVIIPRRECIQTLNKRMRAKAKERVKSESNGRVKIIIKKEDQQMKIDIILAGVGGQGILSIAATIGLGSG
jgi:TPP-dependent indolepyruvate ferredoxin oxidoreductase alpha subunit